VITCRRGLHDLPVRRLVLLTGLLGWLLPPRTAGLPPLLLAHAALGALAAVGLCVYLPSHFARNGVRLRSALPRGSGWGALALA